MNQDRVISKLTDYHLPIWERMVRQSGPFNKEVGKANLLEVKRVFNKHGIEFILAFGTLLGAVRDRDFITWDSDTDILCFREDYLKIEPAFQELESLGFFIPRTNIPLQDHYLIRDGEKIDINWLVDNGHGEMMYMDWIKWNKKYFKRPFPEIDFCGEKFKVNSNHLEFLEITYGKDWMIPRCNKKGFI